jgi:ElaB/YqjD/DUF883 family membrane-anchored ribosome-binding protein
MVKDEEKKRDDLIDQKNRIAKEYRDKMLESSNDIFERADRAVRERKLDAGGEVGILDKFKGAFSLKRGDAIKIPADKTLEWGQDLLKTQNETFREIMNESKETHKSVLENLDRAIAAHNFELENLKKRINEIDSQLATETDPNIRGSLIREKTGKEARSVPDDL